MKKEATEEEGTEDEDTSGGEEDATERTRTKLSVNIVLDEIEPDLTQVKEECEAEEEQKQWKPPEKEVSGGKGGEYRSQKISVSKKKRALENSWNKACQIIFLSFKQLKRI